jgi:flagellar motor switch/type III secretory pathway protein FliN
MARLLTQEEIEALRGSEPYVAAPTERYRVSVEAGSTQLSLEQIRGLEPGDVLPLERRAGEPVEILANAVPVALGELVLRDGLQAVRVVRLLKPGEEPPK